MPISRSRTAIPVLTLSTLCWDAQTRATITRITLTRAAPTQAGMMWKAVTWAFLSWLVVTLTACGESSTVSAHEASTAVASPETSAAFTSPGGATSSEAADTLTSAKGADTVTSAEAPDALRLRPWQPRQPLRTEDWQLLPPEFLHPRLPDRVAPDRVTPDRVAPDRVAPDRIAVDARGLWLLDANGTVVTHHAGQFNTLDTRMLGGDLVVASVDTPTERPVLLSIDAAGLGVSESLRLPAFTTRIEAQCLYRDEAANLYLFLVLEEGGGEQWLVGDARGLIERPLPVRRLSLPPQSGFCAADDSRHLLFINEENVGIWAYDAHPEADLLRRPVDLLAPFGGLAGNVLGLAVVPGTLLALDGLTGHLLGYPAQGEGWGPPLRWSLPGIGTPERLATRLDGGYLDLLVVNDGAMALFATRLGVPATHPAKVHDLPVVLARVQTEPVARVGDAADDPAIWLHPTQPERSRILGTDKRSGLAVHDLQGGLLQFLPVGRLNNIDVRPGFSFDGRTVDLAVASHRDHDSLQFFAIDRDSGQLEDIGQVATPLTDIYGVCLSQSAQGTIDAIVNAKDGRFLQYRLSAAGRQIGATLVREFATRTQPEGCVADDRRGRLFIGEEKGGVWTLDVAAEAAPELSLVAGVGGLLQDDIEGLAFFQDDRHPYLVVSSQGNDSYVVFDGEPPFTLRGGFRIGVNAALAIDGASETDGLEVTSANLGGLWSDGLLVVQDGRRRMPASNQNFKLVSWRDVAAALHLDTPAAAP